ncbi:MAG: UDP-3-O-acyl-N-acetylglucosamine deacetylase [Candidatus Margulisiibacteriota bacterium]
MRNPKFQTTIKKAFTLEGIGLHSGAKVSATVAPAEAGAGVTFNGTRAILSNVTATKRATTIGNVAMVEHLLSAAAGLGIDNLAVIVQGPEIPVLDGSALPWVEALEKAGILPLSSLLTPLIIQQPIRLTTQDASLEAFPYDGFEVEFMVDFKGVGEQKFAYNAEKMSYKAEIAPARTFGYLEEIDALKAQGLGLGASYDNALVLNNSGYVNEPRFPDEPARHKILDLIGDLALLGRPLKARLKASRSGHKLNAELVRRILQP